MNNFKTFDTYLPVTFKMSHFISIGNTRADLSHGKFASPIYYHLKNLFLL